MIGPEDFTDCSDSREQTDWGEMDEGIISNGNVGRARRRSSLVRERKADGKYRTKENRTAMRGERRGQRRTRYGAQTGLWRK